MIISIGNENSFVISFAKLFFVNRIALYTSTKGQKLSTEKIK